MVAGSEGVVGGWDSGTLPTSSMLVSIMVKSPALESKRYHDGIETAVWGVLLLCFSPRIQR